jgi:hypothetical protein
MLLASSGARTKPRSRDTLPQRHHVVALAQLVEVVGPCLHHGAALFNELRPAVGPAQAVAHGVGELGFDDRLGNPQALGQHRASHRAKAVARHLVFREAHAPQRRNHGRVGHGPLAGSQAWEHVAAVPGERLQVAQDRL